MASRRSITREAVRDHHALTPEIDVSIVPVAQHCFVLPLAAWSLMVEHVTGLKLMLHPFDIGVPVHVLPTVLRFPTFVVSQ
jgi:hypothetical protein